MPDIVSSILSESALFSLLLTLGAFQIGLWCQKKLKLAIFNPLLIAVILVIAVVLLTGFPVEQYRADTVGISWLLTPATVCLAVPLYEQLKQLKKNLPAIVAGVTAGTLVSLVSVALMSRMFGLDKTMGISLLPKSITTAMGIVLSQRCCGIEALTTVAIVITGILGSLMGSTLCKVLHLQDPVSMGVAFGTASHVIGTSRANQIDPLTGAVSSLSLAVAGILTAILFPLAIMLL